MALKLLLYQIKPKIVTFAEFYFELMFQALMVKYLLLGTLAQLGPKYAISHTLVFA